MIPVRLRLRNFMSYRDPGEPLEFDGFQLACLSGNNGHGKSALLDAMTWSLWGRARARSEDDLIHHGATEMEVEFEFDLAGNRYRVLRKRALRKAGAGVRGVPALEFQVRAESGFRALTGESVSDTERKIREALGIDYDTFVNSSLILQGKADSFTTRTAAERKKVLSELLNLGQYERLEERARERAREAEADGNKLRSALDEIERELTHREQYEADAERLTREVESLEQKASGKHSDLGKANAELRRLQDLQAVLDRAQAEHAEWDAGLKSVYARLETHQGKIAAARAIVERRPQILAAVARRDDLEQRNDALTERLARRREFERERETHQREIDAARADLEKESARLIGLIDGKQQRAKDVTRLERDRQRVSADLAATADLSTERDEARTRVETIRQQTGVGEALRKQLKADMQGIRATLDTLKAADAICPTCQSKLSPDHKRQVEGQYQREGERMRDAYLGSKRESDEQEQERIKLEARISEIDADLKRRAEVEKSLTRIEQSLGEAEQAAAALVELQAQLQANQARIGAGGYAPDHREARDGIDRALAELPYDATEHDEVRRELGDARRAAEEQRQLELAEQAILSETEAVERLLEDEGRYLLRITGAEKQIETLQAEVVGRAECQRQVARLELELKDAMDAVRVADGKLAKAHQMIDHCERKAQEAAAKRAEVAAVQKRLKDYRELAHAFGKNGIQAMMIETAIPEIQDEANELLGRLTDNRMTVRFDTQRSTKAGDSMIETLDIRIADELGTRDYSLFSGGEAFRINLAIRIALSRLLCRRAGASLQTLIIDEGFGTQDATGRERLVEAINRISEDFQKIIVITHIDELKDHFPTRIEVYKTAEGSQVSVN